ncbi:MAG: DUF4115 domain-containing protein [Candidatus Omnitrophica bacterium]|nr:DUF4115 domain-containing protein [Candidatus Omnitrophota bacterium]MCM8793207.1 DUF4115 domain-containing protein [Candidatus Omnitrophota bacterium]
MLNIGETLKKARESKQLSLEEVYRITHIPTRVLDCLEREEFDKLAGAVYVKSFLKKYAEFLNLNSEEIIKTYLSGLTPASTNNIPVIAPQERIGQRRDFKRLIMGSVSVLVVIFLLTSFLHFLKKSLREGKREKKPLITKTEEKFLIPPGEELVLKIMAKRDTWLQVKADGKILFQHTLKAGSEESWRAKKSFELGIGEAKNLSIFLNGKPLGSLGYGMKRSIVIDHRGLVPNL